MFGWKSKKEKEEEIRLAELHRLEKINEKIKEKERLKQELLAEIRREEEARKLEEEKAKKKAEEEARRIHEAAEKARKEEEERLKNSDEPWFSQIGTEEKDPNNEGVIHFKYDWNDAFIKLLRKNGYKGIDDEAIVQHYLAVMAKVAAEKTSEHTYNEYE